MKRNEPSLAETQEFENDEKHYQSHKSFLNVDLSTHVKATATFAAAMRIGASIPGGSIFQIQSVKNVSVPKRNQEDRTVAYDPKAHMLKFMLTDGFTNGVGLLAPPGHPDLDNTTTPGTKIQLIKPVQLVSGILLLDGYNVDFLGGFVESIVKQWRQTNQLEMSRAWGSEVTPLGGEVPPPWRPFGQAVNVGNKRELVTFKAMAVVRDAREGPGQSTDMTEFEAVRKEAIADLIKRVQIDPKKSFAEGKQLTNKDILSITIEGFTEDEARMTLKRFKNNRAAALKFLIERRDGTRPERRKPLASKSKFGDDESDPEPEPDPTHQPSRDITLFGFIKPVIPHEEAEADKNKALKKALDEEFVNFFSFKDPDTAGSGTDRERSSRGRSSRGSGRRSGGRGGRFGGRSDRGQGRQPYNNEPTAKEVYEPYRGRPTDFPAMGETETASQPPLYRDNTSRVQNHQSNAQISTRPVFRPQGVTSFDDYGAERADKHSRRQYKPFEQVDKEREYRVSSGNLGRSSYSTTGDSYNRSFTSTQYRSPPQVNPLSSVSACMSRPSAPPMRSQAEEYLHERQIDRGSEFQTRSPFSASTAYTQAPSSVPGHRPRLDQILESFKTPLRGNNSSRNDRETSWNPRPQTARHPPPISNWSPASNGIPPRSRYEWDRGEEVDQFHSGGGIGRRDHEDDYYNRSAPSQSAHSNSGFSQTNYTRRQ